MVPFPYMNSDVEQSQKCERTMQVAALATDFAHGSYCPLDTVTVMSAHHYVCSLMAARCQRK